MSTRAELIKKALEVMKEKKVVTSELLARELGVDRATAETLIAALAAEGYVRELRAESPCRYCPFARICTSERRSRCPLLRSNLRVYVLAKN